MHRYELSVLKALRDSGSESLAGLSSSSGLGRDEVMWALENLKENGMVKVSYVSNEALELTEEGRLYAGRGLPEVNLLARLRKGKVRVSELQGKEERIGLQWAKEKGWVSIEGGELRLTRAAEALSDKDRTVEGLERQEKTKRKLAVLVTKKEIGSVSITEKGIASLKDGASGSGAIDSVDRSVIASGSWEGKGFKRYDVGLKVERRAPAMRHPLKVLIEDLKDAYASMGFSEISGPAVESSFWVFDSLFVPQDHPARDAQDTFYVSNLENQPEASPAVKRVRRAHEKGWHSKWGEDVAGQMLLRAHTTSVSARHLYRIIDELRKDPGKYELPIKLFSVGRVFRNESVDYRHLADFYQHDGLVIGKNLTLSNLFDQLTTIYRLLGIRIKFKPSYFPFVEPGVEFLAYSERRKEWIELGGAGMIREEITGVSRSRLSVLAWGPGLDRALMIKDQSISSISELYNGGMGWIRARSGV